MASTLTTAQQVMADAMSEDELLTAVIDLARSLGWRTAHFRPAKTAQGWRTAVQGDGAGFPDLLLLRDDVGIAVELKSMRGRLDRAQADWLIAFGLTGWRTAVWTPAMWVSGHIERELRGGA